MSCNFRIKQSQSPHTERSFHSKAQLPAYQGRGRSISADAKEFTPRFQHIYAPHKGMVVGIGKETRPIGLRREFSPVHSGRSNSPGSPINQTLIGSPVDFSNQDPPYSAQGAVEEVPPFFPMDEDILLEEPKPHHLDKEMQMGNPTIRSNRELLDSLSADLDIHWSIPGNAIRSPDRYSCMVSVTEKGIMNFNPPSPYFPGHRHIEAVMGGIHVICMTMHTAGKKHVQHLCVDPFQMSWSIQMFIYANYMRHHWVNNRLLQIDGRAFSLDKVLLKKMTADALGRTGLPSGLSALVKDHMLSRIDTYW